MNIFETINQYLAWNQHLAGWGQGLGGAAAIIAAFLIARGDRRAGVDAEIRLQDKLTQAALVPFAQGVAIILAKVKIINDAENTAFIRSGYLDADDIDSAIDAIDAFPLHSMHEYRIVANAHLLKGQLKATKYLMAHAVERIKDNEFHQEQRIAFEQLAEAAKKLLSEVAAVAAEREKLGTKPPDFWEWKRVKEANAR